MPDKELREKEIKELARLRQKICEEILTYGESKREGTDLTLILDSIFTAFNLAGWRPLHKHTVISDEEIEKIIDNADCTHFVCFIDSKKRLRVLGWARRLIESSFKSGAQAYHDKLARITDEELVEKAPLITNDEYDHPQYPNQTRLKVIPLWGQLYTHEENQFRLVCEAQRDADHKFYLSHISTVLKAREIKRKKKDNYTYATTRPDSKIDTSDFEGLQEGN